MYIITYNYYKISFWLKKIALIKNFIKINLIKKYVKYLIFNL